MHVWITRLRERGNVSSDLYAVPLNCERVRRGRCACGRCWLQRRESNTCGIAGEAADGQPHGLASGWAGGHAKQGQLSADSARALTVPLAERQGGGQAHLRHSLMGSAPRVRQSANLGVKAAMTAQALTNAA